jgi:hypothetical protein
MKMRQKMSIPGTSSKANDRLLFYDEIRKFIVLDQLAQDIDVAQHIGKSRIYSRHQGTLAEHSRDNEYLLYGYRLVVPTAIADKLLTCKTDEWILDPVTQERVCLAQRDG